MTASIYQLRIELQLVQPPVWRRIQVPGSATLFELHRAIQIAMGWSDVHQHEFDIGNARYGDPEGEDSTASRNEREFQVEKLAVVGETWGYVYDFGEGWQHSITIEAAIEPVQGAAYPVVVGGERACPPEDVHGPFGYEDWLYGFEDPKHPNHRINLGMVPEGWRPDVFDLDAANAALSAPAEPEETRLP